MAERIDDETRTVFAGIKAAYEPDALVGRLVVERQGEAGEDGAHELRFYSPSSRPSIEMLAPGGSLSVFEPTPKEELQPGEVNFRLATGNVGVAAEWGGTDRFLFARQMQLPLALANGLQVNS